jgi:hypothetical protein
VSVVVGVCASEGVREGGRVGGAVSSCVRCWWSCLRRFPQCAMWLHHVMVCPAPSPSPSPFNPIPALPGSGVGGSPGVHWPVELPAATSFPQVVTTAASFNASLFAAIGAAVGLEGRARAKCVSGLELHDNHMTYHTPAPPSQTPSASPTRAMPSFHQRACQQQSVAALLRRVFWCPLPCRPWSLAPCSVDRCV